MFPGIFSYYSYAGSLTSPPCEEYTQWYVVKDPIEFGFSGIEMIKKVLDKTGSEPPATGKCGETQQAEPIKNDLKNARVVQDINERDVFLYDAVANGCLVPEKKKPRGHFERLETTVSKYIYVDNDRPTGISGSYVVSEAEATNGLGKEKVGLKEIGSTAPGYQKP